MSRTRLQLVQELASRMGELELFEATSAGLVTQVVSTNLTQLIPNATQNMAAWVHCLTGANEGVERRARAYAPTSSTLVLYDPGFPVATADGDTFEFHARTRRSRKIEAINSGIRQLGLFWPSEMIDTSLRTVDDTWSYDLPVGVNFADITKVEIDYGVDTLNPYGASQFESGAQQYLSSTSTDFATGNIDFWGDTWFYLDSLAADQVLMSRWTQTGSIRQWRLQILSSGVLRFQGSTTGANNAGSVSSSVTIVPGQWYHVIFGYDSVNDLTFIQVDDNPRQTASLVGGVFVATPDFRVGAQFTTDINSPVDGRMQAASFGKNPVGGIAALLTAMSTRLYNDGLPLSYNDITSLEKTNWGLISRWDLADVGTADRGDSHGNNDLTNNNGVTNASGVVEIFSRELIGYPFQDASAYDWGLRRATDASGLQTQTIQFGNLPPAGRIIRVTGFSYYNELTSDDAVLPISGQWEGKIFDWLMDWGKYRLLDETVERQPGGEAERYRQRALDKLNDAKNEIILTMRPRGSQRILTPWSGHGSLPGGINLDEFNIIGLTRAIS